MERYSILYNYNNSPVYETYNINEIKNSDGLHIILNYNIKIFPIELLEYDKIKSLKIMNENIEIPKDIYKLKNLEELIITCNKLSQYIYNLENLRFLELINFNGYISNELNKIKNLDKLIIYGNYILSFDIFLYHPNINLSITNNNNNYVLFDNGVNLSCRIVITHFKSYVFIIKDYELLKYNYKDRIKKLEDDNKILINNNNTLTLFLDNLIKELKNIQNSNEYKHKLNNIEL